MTDTDDTDDLLLIPQDFFVIDSDDSGPDSQTTPYFRVVDSLIDKVDSLKKRIKCIESKENLLSTSLESTLDRSCNMQQSERKLSSSENLNFSKSAQSTPQKPHNKLKLYSLPASPNTYRFSPGKSSLHIDKCSSTNSSPKFSSKTADRVSPSEDVDKFLSKVKAIQRINAARNLEKDFNDTTEVQHILREIDKKQRIVDPICNGLGDTNCQVKDKAWQCGDYKDSVPDYGTGMKNIIYKTGQNYSPNHARKDRDVGLDRYPTSDSSLDSSQHTMVHRKPNKDSLTYDPLHSNAVNILNMHKQLLDESDEMIDAREEKNRGHKPKSHNTISNNLGFLNLADIWSTNSQVLHLNQSQLTQKYQEEKMRRKHCEDLIQELQNRNLELQQKLSVAVKVDDSKNAAIQQFQEALEKIMTRMETLYKEKQSWEEETLKLKNKHVFEMNELQQKLSHQETEASKALNLAHGSHEKTSSLEKRCLQLQEHIADIEKRFKDLQDDYESEANKNRQLTEELSKKSLELNENKNTLQQARAEIAQSRRAIEICRTEFTDIKEVNIKLEKNLREEKEENVRLKEQKIILLNQIEDYKKKQNSMQEDLEKNKTQLENIKLELRNFYQGQLEILVRNKLKEFQNQLDKSEANFKEEIRRREFEIAKTAAHHIQQIKDKFSLEIKLLEKKHQEESNLHQIQQDQLKDHLNQLQGELDRLQAKRVNVAKQLQKIMEAQWSEALRIIQNGRSPTCGDDTFSTIDQLNSLKARSYNNLEEMLATQPVGQIIRRHHPPTDDCSIQIQRNENAERENVALPDDTPVSSRSQHNNHLSDREIQKYVNLLLNRPQNIDDQEFVRNSQEDISKFTRGQESTNKSDKQKEKTCYKRPWK